MPPNYLYTPALTNASGTKIYFARVGKKVYQMVRSVPMPLTFTANTAGSTVALTNNGTNAPNVEYSLNDGSWTVWDYSAITLTNAGDTVRFRGVNANGFSTSTDNYSRFVLTGSVSATGSVMSLIDGEAKATTVPVSYCFYRLFYNGTHLTSAPELPATTLANNCYSYMFSGCTALTSIPALPATTLTEGCYRAMFRGCSSLTSIPVLSASTLADECYYQMFYGCTSLTTAMGLPATAMYSGCYREMFYGCTSLVDAPTLSAMNLATGCYRAMFSGCTSLENVSDLPATVLASTCYAGMFIDCTSLVEPPTISATSLSASNCCNQMFSGCTSLNVTSSDTGELPFFAPTSITGTDAVKDMFLGTKGEATDPVAGTSYYVQRWAGLTFTSVGTTSTVYLSNTSNTPDCEYSTDGTTWVTMPTASGSAVSIPAGQSIRVRGVNASGFSKSTSAYSKFVMTGSISASGSIMSLIDGVGETTTIPCNYCFYLLFMDCTSLITPPELPATTLAGVCYKSMFYTCTNLTTAPELPATTLKIECYSCMFKGCTSITTAPELPATTLATSCYPYMFQGCTSLTTAPELLATTLEQGCYYYMFESCESLKVRNSSAEGAILFFTCPSSIASFTIDGMFLNTGGSYTGSPVANGQYYYYQ